MVRKIPLQRIGLALLALAALALSSRPTGAGSYDYPYHDLI
jgi:hypothetical protein